jgi:Transglycosylase SLT domain
MANWTEADIQRQLQRADSNGWTPLFIAAAQANNFTVEFVMAIASRETNMQNIKGDFHDGAFHGFGIMQVDVGTDPAFCASWTPDQVEGSITRGVQILVGKRNSLAAKNITDEKAIAAAYNTGEGNVIRSVQNSADPDRTTTGHDYGADVLARKAVFAKLRSA